jgi:CRP-like cAMP-binding protein
MSWGNRRFDPTSLAEVLVTRLGRLTPLQPAEVEVLRRIGEARFSTIRPRSVLRFGRDEPASRRFILSGWAALVTQLKDGRRQILRILIAGDAIDEQVQNPFRQQSVECLTEVRLASGASLDQMLGDKERFQGVFRAMDLAAAQDRIFILDHITRLGRQTAYERMAHFLLELSFRCEQAGISSGDDMPFPLTQETIGDALGLSLVHTNRTLQLMRREGSIDLKLGRLLLNNKAALQEASEFRPPVLG